MDLAVKIGLALFCGGLVGLERQFRGKPAGLRTCILICLGSTLFLILGQALAGKNADSTRVLGQIITGVGFLGAGVIMAREGMVQGLTTAAVIWILAGIGAALGAGFYFEGVLFTLVTLVILIGVEIIEKRMTCFHGHHEKEK